MKDKATKRKDYFKGVKKTAKFNSKDLTIAHKYSQWLDLLDAFDDELQKDSTQVAVAKEHWPIAESYAALQSAILDLTGKLQDEQRKLYLKFKSNS